MPHVQSSMMSNVEYEEHSRALEVTFTGGKVYRYFDVPPVLYHALLAADSKGAFLNKHILNRFDFKEVVLRAA